MSAQATPTGREPTVRATRGVHPIVAELIEARRRENLSQEALGHRLGVAQSVIWRWEAGRHIDLVQLTRWAAVFELDIVTARLKADPNAHVELLFAGGLA